MSFWANYRREQEARIAARPKAVRRCAACAQPIIKGKRCPSCISERAEGEEKAAKMRDYRAKIAARRARR
jgi:predicted Zn-ribbon and HTH transcriptional regulator